MRKLSILGFLLVSLSMFGQPALARTPDGRTPAEETVCDPLKADGVTKGLYGLCVAFCEARDLADEAVDITPEERELLKSSPQSGGYLAIYDKKKQATDPDMPCINVAEPVVVAEPCPCWSAEEAGEIDGKLSDGSTASGWPAPTNDLSACAVDYSQVSTYIVDFGSVNNLQERTFILVAELPQRHFCQYQKTLQGQIGISRLLEIESGTLTAKELAACKANILARQANLGVCQ